MRVFEIRHVHFGAGVERVDDHLAIDRAGDFDAAVLQVGRDWRDPPVATADVGRLGQEVGQLAGIEPLLTLLAGPQQFEPPSPGAAVQIGHELEGLGREYLFGLGGQRSEDFDADQLGTVLDGGHD